MEITNEIKCVIWDLDHTLWDGVLTESEEVYLKPGIVDVIKTLDERGILHSISSKNNADQAMAKLQEFELDMYFLYPEINWNAKSHSIKHIQENLNLGMDSFLFVDDQDYELDEVQNTHPDIHCMHSHRYMELMDHPMLKPRFITVDSARRREMYQSESKRKQEEADYQGPTESFLATLKMKLFIYPAKEEDLKRAEELTVRTNQLNATGITFSYEELNRLRTSGNHKLLICELKDIYGSYGKIGLALIHKQEHAWVLEMMLMSCRVSSRGIGTVLLNYVMKEAKKEKKRLLANFRDTGKNRMMNISFRFAGFKEKETVSHNQYILEHPLENIPDYPDYIDVIISDGKEVSV